MKTNHRSSLYYEPEESRGEEDSLEVPRVSGQRTLPPLPPPKVFNKGPNAQKTISHYKMRNGQLGLQLGDDRHIGRILPADMKDVNNLDYAPKYGAVEPKHPRPANPTTTTTISPEKTYLWVEVSSAYGKLLFLATLVLCITEILDDHINLMQYQSFYFLFLYLGSALVIVCIYVYTILTRVPSPSESRENLTQSRDSEMASVNSFGTLRRAYIQKSHTARTSFYLRVGALVMGLATLIHTGLEIAVHTTVEMPCVDEITFVHPILQAIFTFLQMHFLFVNSQVVVEASGAIARLGFMHLVATNLAIWLRMVLLDSATEWARIVLNNSNNTTNGPVFTPGFKGSLSASSFSASVKPSKVSQLYKCFQQSALGRMWIEATPFLLPFILEFCLVAAAIYYVMWQNVGKNPSELLQGCGSANSRRSTQLDTSRCYQTRKGLFIGLLTLVATTVLLVIFFVMQAKPEFSDRLIWISLGTVTGVLIITIITVIVGLVVIKQLAYIGVNPLHFDRLLSSTTVIPAFLHGLLSAMAGASFLGDDDKPAAPLLLVYGVLVILHSGLQNTLLAEAARRRSLTHDQIRLQPGRQVLLTLLLSNVALWLLDSFVTTSAEAQQLQISFYGSILWGVLVRVNLPIVALYRFHSAVMLYEIWKNVYFRK